MSIFFFKQKTAYEMRISDWSSDVCSSDLQATGVADVAGERLRSIAAALLQRLQAAFGLAGSGGEVGKQLLQLAARGTQGGELAIQRHGITDSGHQQKAEHRIGNKAVVRQPRHQDSDRKSTRLNPRQ